MSVSKINLRIARWTSIAGKEPGNNPDPMFLNFSCEQRSHPSMGDDRGGKAVAYVPLKKLTAIYKLSFLFVFVS